MTRPCALQLQTQAATAARGQASRMKSALLSLSTVVTVLTACSDSNSQKIPAIATADQLPDMEGELSGLPAPSRSDRKNSVLFQAFHWYLPNDGRHWINTSQLSKELASKGFTGIWLPPAAKSAGGSQDVGYGVYDLYDLGEFNQKGTVRTKYGTKEEYLAAIRSAQTAGLDVYGDIVLNQRLGADRTETVNAVEVDNSQRQIDKTSPAPIQAWTYFDFPGRRGQYSSFVWNWTHFDGVDWDQNRRQGGKIYRFTDRDKNWDALVSDEFGNYDFLLGADIDYDNPEVVKETTSWGLWFTQLANLDGYRLDAVKHIDSQFTQTWLAAMREQVKRPLFAVAEYYDYRVDKLLAYIEAFRSAQVQVSLFDVPLHKNFYDAGKAMGAYNMSAIFQNTLMLRLPSHAVSFVDNHDTQPLQALESPVADWFKPLAYALILLREEAYPAVFYADYFGASYKDRRNGVEKSGAIASQKISIDLMLATRHRFAYGKQHSFFDDVDVIGWTREGDGEHPEGLAVLLSDNKAGSKRMYVGSQHAGRCFRELAGKFAGCVTIDAEGYGEFSTPAQDFTIWSSGGLSSP